MFQLPCPAWTDDEDRKLHRPWFASPPGGVAGGFIAGEPGRFPRPKHLCQRKRVDPGVIVGKIEAAQAQFPPRNSNTPNCSQELCLPRNSRSPARARARWLNLFLPSAPSSAKDCSKPSGTKSGS